MMTEPTLCKICHRETPPEGRSVCDRCMGFDRTKPESPGPNIKPPTETTLHTCETCGELIEPYKIGRQTRTVGECQSCYNKRRYGPNWKPGGHTRDEKAAKCKAWREKKKMEKYGNGNGNKPEAPADTGPPEVQAEAFAMLDSIKAGQAEQAIMAKNVSGALTIKGIKHITLAFVDNDEAMYQRLKDIATRERRSMEQQVLYFLDRVIEV